MYHSITFDEKNTWDDWHLIPSSRPVLATPSVKTNYIELPGTDGIVDLTEEFTGEPLFNNREGSWEFIVRHEYWNSWTEAYNTILNYLHGRKRKAILEDDPNYYYEGRFSVNQWRSLSHYSTIVIDYNVAPYKKAISSSTEAWLWDPFNFRTGVITTFKDMTVNGSRVVVVDSGSDQKVIPKFITSSAMTMVCRGVTYQLKAGTNKFPDVYVNREIVTFTFTGNGTLTIDYRGGSL